MVPGCFGAAATLSLARLEIALSLEVLDTLAALATVVIVAATAAAALVQLRHLRAGNQISAMLSIGERFQASPFIDARSILTNMLPAALEDQAFRDYTAALTRGVPVAHPDPQYVDLRRAAIYVGNAYEELGILVKNDVADRRLFLDRFSWVITRDWELLERFLAYTRAVADNPSLFEHFEFLYILATQWERDYPTSLPKGTKRLNLRSPWPVPPPPPRDNSSPP